MNVGVGWGLVVCVDRKKAEARRGEEPKDAGREEGGSGDPLWLMAVAALVRTRP